MTSQSPPPDEPARAADDFERILRHEKRMAEVLRIRNPEKPLRWWESPQLMSALVAVATVFLSSTAAYVMQREARTREFGMKHREVLLEQRRDALRTLYDLIAARLKANEDLLYFVTGEYASLTASQVDTLFAEITDADGRWRREREINEVLMRFFYGSDTGVNLAWSSVRGALQAYVNCAESVYVVHRVTRKASSDACKRERVGTEAAERQLREALAIAYERQLK